LADRKGDTLFLISKYLDRIFQQTDLENRRVIFSLLEHNRDAKLLDLGCGDGSFTLMVAERIGTKDIYGIDTVRENVTKAKEKGIVAYPGDLNEKLPFEDESFDVIHANQIIEHLSNTDLFIRELHRVCRKRGYCIVSTPNLASLHNILYLLFGKQPPTVMLSDRIVNGKEVSQLEGPRHRRIFTLTGLSELCAYHGFQVVEIRYAGYYPLPVLLARVMCFIDKNHSAYITVKVRRFDSR